jgi:hypothetical protein
VGGRLVRVEVRLREDEAAVLDRLARRLGGKAKAIRAAIMAFEDRQAILDRLDRIEARLGSGAPPGPRDAAALRAVAAGILALEEGGD